MAVSYTIAKHGVCFPTKVLSGNCGHVLNITLTSDTDNGNFVKIGNWQELDRYAEGAATALSAVVRGKSARGNWYVEVTADNADTLLVYQDPIVAESNWGKRLSNFLMRALTELQLLALLFQLSLTRSLKLEIKRKEVMQNETVFSKCYECVC